MRIVSQAIRRWPKSLHLLHTARSRRISPIDSINGPLHHIDIEEFRQKAFIPERPLLIDSTSSQQLSNKSALPAATKWFTKKISQDENVMLTKHGDCLPSFDYLLPYADILLPYELIISKEEFENRFDHTAINTNSKLKLVLSKFLENTDGVTFHRFWADLQLFLDANRSSPPLPKLYIAQAQITALPPQLQADLPTPRIVLQAGRGDVYDANIWMGLPPTYTPLHKDPNPNLFVQLAGRKCIRLFEPNTGAAIFRHVQESIGQNASSSFRGSEMMEGPERAALHEAVWLDNMEEGYEVTVDPMDSLFIPKGWWHSIKSIGTGVNASVNVSSLSLFVEFLAPVNTE